MATELFSKDGEPIDLVLWREGRREAGAVEAALDANPGLAACPPVLPARVKIVLPPPATTPIRPTIRLWD